MLGFKVYLCITKLILGVSGGVTGLAKENTIDTDSLDVQTKEELIGFFKTPTVRRYGDNLNEYWILDDEKEIRVKKENLPYALIPLNEVMKKNLGYKKNHDCPTVEH